MEYAISVVIGLLSFLVFAYGNMMAVAYTWDEQKLIDSIYKKFNPAINLAPLSLEESDVFTFVGTVDAIKFFRKVSYEQAHDAFAQRVWSGFFTSLARQLVPTLSVVYVKSVNITFPSPFKRGSVITAQISYSLRAPRNMREWSSEEITAEVENLKEQISNKQQTEEKQEVTEEVFVKKIRSIVILKGR